MKHKPYDSAWKLARHTLRQQKHTLRSQARGSGCAHRDYALDREPDVNTSVMNPF
jgi:Fe-S cluster assembly iron-binding protein IscA